MSRRAEDHHPSDAVRREAERLRGLLETAPNAIVIVDEGGEIVLVNAETETMFGYGREELIGQSLEILVPERARHTHGKLRERFTAQPSLQRMSARKTLRARRKDGSEFAAEIGLGWLETPEGLLISSVISDVSERGEAQRAIGHLAAIVESSDDAIVGQTLDGTITSWNPAAELMYGYNADQAIGCRTFMLCPSADQRDELIDIFRRVAAGGRVDHFETTRRRKDGRVFDVSVTVSPIRGADGAVAGASTVARDISERRRAAEALAEAEERFRSAFEEAPIGMALIDLDGRINEVNAALCMITGYSVGRLEAVTVDELMHPDDAGDFEAELNAFRAGRQRTLGVEKRFIHASGHPVWVALEATQILGRDRQPTRLLAQIQDITDRKRYEDRLQDLADHDSLTGLLNRHSFARELESHAALANRYGSEGALLMLDLDHFKYVNDTLGHQAGDEIIVRAAELLTGRLRESDVLARLGGDEFAILLPKADAAAAEHVAMELLEEFGKQPITVVGVGTRAISASIGVAIFDQDLSGEDVLVNADVAMYEAKGGGRNRVVLYRPDQHSQARMKGRFSWVQRIQSAFDEQRFTLMAQPIIDYQTGRTSQHELLLRMRDEHGDLIPPSAFLYIAERLDLVQQIDAWVIQQAIRLVAEDSPLGDGLPLSVNISGRSLGEPRLLELIEHELARTGVSPGRLTFEITETAAVRHITHAHRFSDRLAELGCRLAVDEFGAGFSSFYFLKHLPFDFLKIDGEFVRNCLTSKTDRLVIEAVVGIAQGLGKRTVAEFVGDEETARLLTRLGVDFGQGLHHGRPVPVGDSALPAPGGASDQEASEPRRITLRQLARQSNPNGRVH